MEECFCEFVIYYRFRRTFTLSNVSVLSSLSFILKRLENLKCAFHVFLRNSLGGGPQHSHPIAPRMLSFCHSFNSSICYFSLISTWVVELDCVCFFLFWKIGKDNPKTHAHGCSFDKD
jgi:hypothetical protein